MLDFKRYEVFTFDCYGTLIDWENGIINAVRRVLSRHDIETDDETILQTYAEMEAKYEEGDFVPYRLVLRFVMVEMSLRFGFDATPEELDSLVLSVPQWVPFPDTVAALEKLKRKYKLAVISNIDDVLFESSARRLQFPFDWVTTAEQAGAYKPSLRPFQVAIEKIGRPCERILHVAQSVYHDIIPAGKLGIDRVWVNRRAGKTGSGATKAASAVPDLEVLNLQSLVEMIESG